MDEPKLKIRAREHITVEGRPRKPGEEFELPEREALGLVGQGQAEQVGPAETGEQAKKRDEQLASESGERDIDKIEDEENKSPGGRKKK